MAIAMLWETLMPRRQLASGVFWRWVNNFSLGALTWYVSALAGTWFLLWLAQWTSISQYGLLSKFDAGPIIGFCALLLVSQFVNYWIHVAFHHFTWLWPIHAVHHADVEVDVSTSYRHHPLEPIISLPVFVPIIVLLGASPEAVAVYRLLEVTATIFSHSNVRIPKTVEKYLRWVVLTPDFHRLHHCTEVHFTNSNYGSIVPWFDYLFGTASHRPYDEQESMALGLEYFREPGDYRLDRQLLMPLHAPSMTIENNTTH